jgi:hypothetical protein
MSSAFAERTLMKILILSSLLFLFPALSSAGPLVTSGSAEILWIRCSSENFLLSVIQHGGEISAGIKTNDDTFQGAFGIKQVHSKKLVHFVSQDSFDLVVNPVTKQARVNASLKNGTVLTNEIMTCPLMGVGLK